jgi:hypothetical protein
LSCRKLRVKSDEGEQTAIVLKGTAAHLMVWIGVPLASLLWMIGGADMAHGQVSEAPSGEKPSGEPAVTLGEFRVTPSLMIAERYDNNIFYSSRAKVDDFLTDTEPRVKIISKGRPVDVFADLGVKWTQYAEHPKLSYFSSSGGLDLKADNLTGRALRGLGLTVSEHYYYTKDYPTFAALEGPNPAFGGPNPIASGGVQQDRVTTFGNVTRATASYVMSPRATVLGGYTNARTQYIGGTTSLVSSTIDIGTAGLEYSLTPITTLLSGYTYSHFSFGGAGSAETHAADVGARHQFMKDWSVDGRVGGTYLPSIDRLTYNFNVGTTKTFSATQVSVRGLRAVSTSGGLAAALSIRHAAQLSISHQLTPALTANLAGNYGTAESVGTNTVNVKSYGVTSGIRYALKRWADLFASYSYFNQQSTGAVGLSVNRTQVIVGITLTWQ